MSKGFFIITFLTLISCATKTDPMTSLDTQGHRGCRGTLPENSIPAFIEALEVGVQTLELDVVISQDDQVVVSHEPWLSHELFRSYDQQQITPENEKSFNLYQMMYAEIETIEYGVYDHPRFPEQNKMAVYKPLLSSVIQNAEQYALNNDRPAPYYNIEIKRIPSHDDIFHPAYKKFTDIVIETIKKEKIDERIIIQCFDQDVLRYMHEKYPEYDLAFLIENNNSFEKNIEELGFIPEIYSPYYMLVHKGLMDYANSKDMLVIPWTVNKRLDMVWLMELGVHGIISDFPERLINEWAAYQKKNTL